MKKKSSGEYKQYLVKNGIPVPRERIVNVRSSFSKDDWWYQNAKGQWYWLDGRQGAEKMWKTSIYGPD